MASTSNLSEEDSLLLARVKDAQRLCEKRHAPCFVGFLDERQRGLVQQAAPHAQLNTCFWGGYPQAERVFFGVFAGPVRTDAFPIVPVLFTYRPQAELSHRDFLGAFMAAGIRRETVGDILCTEGRTVALLDASVADFLCTGLDTVGREGVKITVPYTGSWDFAARTQEYTDTVPSLRLDAVLHVMLRDARTRAAERIRTGAVSVNHEPCLSASRLLSEGDTVSVRGSGRYVLRQVGSISKKGRIFITVAKFV
ncbi:MAG: hypothetical protein IKI50_05555 [Clostridia bacterium]|nr:hypothetical protein [Clostridia bacterium]